MKIRSQGATLMELMTALAVLGVLVGIAIPGFRHMLADSRSTGFTNDLVTALNLARSEALHRTNSVAVCASANQTTCSASSNWATGWLVYEDRTGTPLTYDPPTDQLLRAWPPLSNGIAVTASAASNGNNTRVIYDATGMGVASIQFDFIPTGCVGTRAGRTNVLFTGAIRSIKVACP